MSLQPRKPKRFTSLHGTTLRVLVLVLELLGNLGSWLAATFTKRLFSFDRLCTTLRSIVELGAAEGSATAVDAAALATSALDERPLPGRHIDGSSATRQPREALSYARVWALCEAYSASVGKTRVASVQEAAPPTAFEERGIRTGSCLTYHQLYRQRVCTPLQILESTLSAIRKMEQGGMTAWGPSPFSQVFEERARRAANASAQRYAREPQPQPLSVLDGVLVVVKDSVNVAGRVTSSGTRIHTIPPYRDAPRVADADALLIERLEAAGAVVLGKTKMTEFGLDPLGFSEVYAMPPCAFSERHAAGGSSTGSAAAVARVALLHVPVAYGTDGGGSVRIPAAWNGLFGLKPTHAFLLPRRGDPGIACSSVGHGGVLGVSVLDLVAFLVAAVQDTSSNTKSMDHLLVHADESGDGYAPRGSAKHAVAMLLDRLEQWSASLNDAGQIAVGSTRKLRIGIPLSEWQRCSSAAIRRTGLDALHRLADRGWAELVTIPQEHISLQPFASALGAIYLPLDALECLLSTDWSFKPRSELLEYGSRLVLHTVKGITGADMAVARRARAALRVQLATLFRRNIVDVLALPTTDTLPVAFRPDRKPCKDLRATWQAVTYTFVANIAGLPAGTAPVGLVPSADAQGSEPPVYLPVGIQFIGDAYDDATVVQALALIEHSGMVPALPSAP